MNGYLLFIDSHAWEAKINQNNQPDRPSHVGWPGLRQRKILWKTATKIKVSFTENNGLNKVLHLKVSAAYQKSIILSRKFYLSKRM